MTEEISKAYDNVFDALDLPIEAAASRLAEEFATPQNVSYWTLRIADVIREAVAEEHKRLRTILGFDVTKEEEKDGQKYTVCHDPYWNLQGAVINLEEEGADKVCISTIKKHQARLIAFEKATKPLDRHSLVRYIANT